MFTGIVECTGNVLECRKDNKNLHITIKSAISSELKHEQSVNHNGVCLTVVSVHDSSHIVTAVDETLRCSNLANLKMGDLVNLERAMPVNGRFDGHLVQGHVDETAECISVEDQNGSWLYTFAFTSLQQNLLVEKGSICINGVSLTTFNVKQEHFSVAIIPYTIEHTNFRHLKPEHTVNLEFDIIGKYIAKWMETYQRATKK
jgi:riboflavin synthase